MCRTSCRGSGSSWPAFRMHTTLHFMVHSMLHSMQRGRLGTRERVHPAIGPADGEQRASHDPVRVPVDEVVAGVGAVHGEAGDRVGERE
eukprot:scaffold61712_cov69-Phaeocystis_antarctica.AAC.2